MSFFVEPLVRPNVQRYEPWQTFSQDILGNTEAFPCAWMCEGRALKAYNGTRPPASPEALERMEEHGRPETCCPGALYGFPAYQQERIDYRDAQHTATVALECPQDGQQQAITAVEVVEIARLPVNAGGRDAAGIVTRIGTYAYAFETDDGSAVAGSEVILGGNVESVLNPTNAQTLANRTDPSPFPFQFTADHPSISIRYWLVHQPMTWGLGRMPMLVGAVERQIPRAHILETWTDQRFAWNVIWDDRTRWVVGGTGYVRLFAAVTVGDVDPVFEQGWTVKLVGRLAGHCQKIGKFGYAQQNASRA